MKDFGIINDDAPEIEYGTVGDELNVTIKTGRLYLASVTQKQESPYYKHLFGDPNVMQRFRTGETYPLDRVKRIVREWVGRWEKGYPFSAFSVEKGSDNEFIGHVALKDGKEEGGNGGQPGEAEFSYLFAKSQWGQGFGKEAVQSVKLYAFDLACREPRPEINGAPFNTLIACVRTDNPASERILKKTLKMDLIKEEEKHGAMRKHYRLNVP